MPMSIAHGRLGVDRRVVAQHQHVDLGHVDRLDLGRLRLQRLKNSARSLYLRFGKQRAWTHSVSSAPRMKSDGVT